MRTNGGSTQKQHSKAHYSKDHYLKDNATIL